MKILNKATKMDEAKVRVLLWHPETGFEPRVLEKFEGRVEWQNGKETDVHGPIRTRYLTAYDGKPCYVFHKETGSPLWLDNGNVLDLDGVTWAELHETDAFGQLGDIANDEGKTLRDVVTKIAWVTGIVGGGFVLYLIVSTLVGGA